MTSYMRGSEQCDDGNTVDGDGCSSTCLLEAMCGNGQIEGTEQCDDSNTEGADGCSNACTIEPGYTCSGEPSTCETTCGDGIKVGSEQCDDDNTTSGDGCSATCQTEPRTYPFPNPNFPYSDYAPMITTTFSVSSTTTGCQNPDLNASYSDLFSTIRNIYPPFWFWSFDRLPQNEAPQPLDITLPSSMSIGKILTLVGGVSQGEGTLTHTETFGTYPAVLGSGLGRQETYTLTISGHRVTEQFVYNVQLIRSSGSGIKSENRSNVFTSEYDIETGIQTYSMNLTGHDVGFEEQGPGCSSNTNSNEDGTGTASYY